VSPPEVAIASHWTRSAAHRRSIPRRHRPAERGVLHQHIFRPDAGHRSLGPRPPMTVDPSATLAAALAAQPGVGDRWRSMASGW